jgi:uncharacterized protein YkwD
VGRNHQQAIQVMRASLKHPFTNKHLFVALFFLMQTVLVLSSLAAVSHAEMLNLDSFNDQSWRLVSTHNSSNESSLDASGRQNQQASHSFTVFIPLVERSTYIGELEEAKIAIERVNYYRNLAGVPSLQVRETVIDAAQNHADYYLLNYADEQAWEYGVHGEVVGKPGFTGKWPYDRMQAANYPYFGSAEVMHFIADPIGSVDGWISGILHRVILLEPILTCGGYGSGKNEQVAVDVINLGIGDNMENQLANSSPYPLSYPADGQQGVPRSWNGNESPDPLPAGATRPVGYPFTLQGVMGKLFVDWAEMRDGAGQVVAVHPNPPLCPQFNCYALIPVQPLSPRSTYSVTAQGSVGGVAFTQSWTFTTGDDDGLNDDVLNLAGEWFGPWLPQPVITENRSGSSSD